MTATGVVWDPAYLEHVTDEGHPDHPRRLKPLYHRLKELAVRNQFVSIVPSEATEEEILLVHSPAYLAKVRATAGQAASALSADTLTCDRSWQIARLAVGGTIGAIRQVAAEIVDGEFAHCISRKGDDPDRRKIT